MPLKLTAIQLRAAWSAACKVHQIERAKDVEIPTLFKMPCQFAWASELVEVDIGAQEVRAKLESMLKDSHKILSDLGIELVP